MKKIVAIIAATVLTFLAGMAGGAGLFGGSASAGPATSQSVAQTVRDYNDGWLDATHAHVCQSRNVATP